MLERVRVHEVAVKGDFGSVVFFWFKEKRDAERYIKKHVSAVYVGYRSVSSQAFKLYFDMQEGVNY